MDLILTGTILKLLHHIINIKYNKWTLMAKPYLPLILNKMLIQWNQISEKEMNLKITIQKKLNNQNK
jgi:hypothetical protein